MKLHLKMVGGDSLDLDIPDCEDLEELEFSIKSGQVLKFPNPDASKGVLNVMGNHIQAWSVDPVVTTSSSTTTTAKPK